MKQPLIMTNKQYQALGKVSRVTEVYLLDCFNERIQRLPVGSEEHSKYSKEDLEIIRTKPLTTAQILLDSEPCLY